ncbi:MAG: TetR family transcriptional regulator [Streptosporangiales bacterium]|nr:TetR family transcriptional regulator [Streptosporangiales bacterium]
MARTGRRPGPTETRGEILAAARRLFGDLGYDGTTIRGIAREAGVDPALVHHFFGTKERVFVAAMEFPFDPEDIVPEIIEGPRAELGERFVRFFVRVWGDPQSRSGFLALVRSASSNERAAAMLRQFVTSALLARVAEHTGLPRLRMELAAAQLMGIALMRYILKVEPLASADDDEVAALVAPVIQHYLGTGEV